MIFTVKETGNRLMKFKGENIDMSKFKPISV